MIEIRTTDDFETWIRKLRDKAAKAIILRRIDRLSLGNFGNVRPVGEGISELKIDVGPGYRVYCKQTGLSIVLLLAAATRAPRTVISSEPSSLRLIFEEPAQ